MPFQGLMIILDEGWIGRGFQACEAAGVPEGHWVRHFLENDPSEPKHEGVEWKFRELFMRRHLKAD